MPEFNLYNGVSIPDLCYGTSIVYLYRYGETNFARRANYWLKNCIKNRPQIKLDISAPKAIKSTMEIGAFSHGIVNSPILIFSRRLGMPGNINFAKTVANKKMVKIIAQGINIFLGLLG